jgi:hypothetical protein
MKFGAKRDPLLFRAKFHSKSLYSVEKKIVGMSQYAYFSFGDFLGLLGLFSFDSTDCAYASMKYVIRKPDQRHCSILGFFVVAIGILEMFMSPFGIGLKKWDYLTYQRKCPTFDTL